MTRRRRGRLSLLLALLALALGLVVAPAATAQEDGDAPTYIRGIDATDPEQVVLQLMYQGDDLGDVQITSDEGVDVGEPSPFIDNETPIGLAVVVDTGNAMDESGALQATRDALNEFVDAKPESMELAIIAAADTADLVVDFTPNVERLHAAIDSLGPSPRDNTALWGGVDIAAGILDATRADQQPNLLVITAGADTATPTSQGTAIARAKSSGTAAWIIAGNGPATGPLQNLVSTNGGYTVGLGAAGDVPDQVDTFGSWLVDSQWIVPFVPEQTTGVVPVELTVGDTQLEAAYTANQFPQGKQELAPSEAGSGGIFSFLTGSLAKWLGLLLFVLAAVGLAYGLVLLVVRDDSSLTNVLQPYAEGYSEEPEEEESGLARSALIQRAVEVTEQVAEQRGYLSRTEAALERANLPLRAGEALFFYVCVVTVVTLFFLVITGSLLAGLVIGGIVALIPPAVVSFLAGQRRRKFVGQLPDTLQLLAGTLRAGYSLMQGVEAVSQEVAEPMGKELRRVVTESRLGRPLEESLDSVAERMASPDFAWAVMAIRIQREVGGNLSELLLTVADTMTARERLRRDISALTAEGRISAIVLGILPVGLGLAMWVINPAYMSKLFDNTLGNVLLGLAIVGMLVGFAWMRQIIKIEI